MSEGKKAKEDVAELARERKENLQRALRRKRSFSIALAFGFAAAAAIAWPVASEMGAFCLLVVSLMLVVRYFDANSHLHEVRRRSAKSLVPDLSVLRRDRHPPEPKASRPMPHS